MVIYFYHKSLNICLRVVHKYYFSKVIKPGLLVNSAEIRMKFSVICLSFINPFKIHKLFFKGDDFVSKTVWAKTTKKDNNFEQKRLHYLYCQVG